MPLKEFRPLTPSLRFTQLHDFSELTPGLLLVHLLPRLPILPALCQLLRPRGPTLLRQVQSVSGASHIHMDH